MLITLATPNMLPLSQATGYIKIKKLSESGKKD